MISESHQSRRFIASCIDTLIHEVRNTSNYGNTRPELAYTSDLGKAAILAQLINRRWKRI
jgi:hypothetical protein